MYWDSLSTAIKMVSCPLDFGKPEMKSTETCSQMMSGISNGCSNPPGAKVLDLLRWKISHSLNKSLHCGTHPYPIQIRCQPSISAIIV